MDEAGRGSTSRTGTTSRRRTGAGPPILHARAVLDLLQDRDKEALKKLDDGEQLASRLGPGQALSMMIRRWQLPTLARVGDIERVWRALEQVDERDWDDAQMRIALAWVRLIGIPDRCLARPRAVSMAQALASPGSWPACLPLEAIKKRTHWENRLGRTGARTSAGLAEPDGCEGLLRTEPRNAGAPSYAGRCTRLVWTCSMSGSNPHNPAPRNPANLGNS